MFGVMVFWGKLAMQLSLCWNWLGVSQPVRMRESTVTWVTGKVLIEGESVPFEALVPPKPPLNFFINMVLLMVAYTGKPSPTSLNSVGSS